MAPWSFTIGTITSIPTSEVVRLGSGRRGLDDIPFHAVKLLHGHVEYEGVSIVDHKRMLVGFTTFVRRLPIIYHVFSYTSYDG